MPKSLESVVKYNNKIKNDIKSLNLCQNYEDWAGDEYVDKY